MNIPICSVLVSILSAVPPTPTSNLVLTNNSFTSSFLPTVRFPPTLRSPSMFISFVNLASPSNINPEESIALK